MSGKKQHHLEVVPYISIVIEGIAGSLARSERGNTAMLSFISLTFLLLLAAIPGYLNSRKIQILLQDYI